MAGGRGRPHPTRRSNWMTTLSIVPGEAAWRARSVRYFSGDWAGILTVLPEFSLVPFNAGKDEPANPFLQTVTRREQASSAMTTDYPLGSARAVSSGTIPRRTSCGTTRHRGFELSLLAFEPNLLCFNGLKLGPKTPIAPGRGENRPFRERFGLSFRSRSPECAGQPRGNLGVFHPVSPAESGSPLR